MKSQTVRGMFSGRNIDTVKAVLLTEPTAYRAGNILNTPIDSSEIFCHLARFDDIVKLEISSK